LAGRGGTHIEVVVYVLAVQFLLLLLDPLERLDDPRFVLTVEVNLYLLFVLKVGRRYLMVHLLWLIYLGELLNAFILVRYDVQRLVLPLRMVLMEDWLPLEDFWKILISRREQILGWLSTIGRQLIWLVGLF